VKLVSPVTLPQKSFASSTIALVLQWDCHVGTTLMGQWKPIRNGHGLPIFVVVEALLCGLIKLGESHLPWRLHFNFGV
jgi:hypothetical protein